MMALITSVSAMVVMMRVWDGGLTTGPIEICLEVLLNQKRLLGSPAVTEPGRCGVPR